MVPRLFMRSGKGRIASTEASSSGSTWLIGNAWPSNAAINELRWLDRPRGIKDATLLPDRIVPCSSVSKICLMDLWSNAHQQEDFWRPRRVSRAKLTWPYRSTCRYYDKRFYLTARFILPNPFTLASDLYRFSDRWLYFASCRKILTFVRGWETSKP